MSVGPLPIPPGVRSRLFRGVVKKLQADPRLDNVINTWRVWEGNSDDAADATLSELPWVRITPTPGNTAAAAIGLYQSDLQLVFELKVAGLDPDPLLDLWEQFERVLFPGDGSMQAMFLKLPLVIGDAGLVQPAFGISDLEGAKIWNGRGTYRIGLTINTLL